MNLKKIIATNLSFIFAVSFCKDSVFANWTPYDYKDPTCINISMLGNGIDRMHLPKEKKIWFIPIKEKVCGCKTCEVDAIMFSQLNEYVKELPKKMKIIDRKVFNDKQVSIHWETFGNIATAALHIAASKVPFIPGLQPGASLIIFYVGAEIIGLGVRTLGDH